MNRQLLVVLLAVVTLLEGGCAGLGGIRRSGELRPVDLSRTSMCAINQELAGKEVYVSGVVVALSEREFLLECQEMKGHRLWVETSAANIPFPDTTGQIVGVYGVVTISQAGNEPRLSAKGIEYLGKAVSEEHRNHDGGQGSHGGHDGSGQGSHGGHGGHH